MGRIIKFELIISWRMWQGDEKAFGVFFFIELFLKSGKMGQTLTRERKRQKGEKEKGENAARIEKVPRVSALHNFVLLFIYAPSVILFSSEEIVLLL